MTKAKTETNIKTKPEVLSRSQLFGRGWTDTGIRRFLGDADSARPNTYNRAAGPMKLWTTARVEAVEESADCAAWLQSSKQRRAESEAVADAHRAEVVDTVDAVVIEVEQVDIDDARACAIWAYNQRDLDDASKVSWAHERPTHEAMRLQDTGYRVEATVDSDPEFLDRITVKFLRYHRTSYDAIGENIFRLFGRRVAHELLFERVLGAIAAEYPSLAAECFRQMNAHKI